MTRLEIICEQEKRILKNLKDFQLATVKEVDKLFWNKNQQRVLVSDEVGLGKTLVAKGVIVEYAKHFFEEHTKSKLNIVYVCSNAAISNQNISKLSIGDCCLIEDTSSARLSMQHMLISRNKRLENENPLFKKFFINIIPITPATSLRLPQGAGIVDERRLMFIAISKTKGFKKKEEKDKLNTLFKVGARTSWTIERHKEYESRILNSCEENYLDDLIRYVENNILPKEVPDSFKKRENVKGPYTFVQAIKDGKTSIINYMRYEFAKRSLDLLEPDLVIMDEFQRFKDLLDYSNTDTDETKCTEQQLLARKFFNENRVLLLSATPYKMYSTLEEIDEYNVDQHFSEFFNVIDFLKENNPTKIEKFKNLWNDYSRELRAVSLDSKTTFMEIKRKVEKELSKNLCRTERISVKNQIDLIEKELPKLKISQNDIRAYIQAQKVLDILNETDSLCSAFPIDYAKSCPFLLSYMNKYKFKEVLKTDLSRLRKNGKIAEINQPLLWLTKDFIDDYSDIHGFNARLDSLLDIVFAKKAEKLLWVPPSMPYYTFGGDFAGIENFSKLLLFSSWEMVPRMVSSLISYEAERKIFKELEPLVKDKKLKYFLNDEENDEFDEEEASDDRSSKKSKKRRYPSSRLNFALSKKKTKPSAMVLFSLMYPSRFLRKIYNPMDYLGKDRHYIEEVLVVKIKEAAEKKIRKTKLPREEGNKNAWIYLLPLILDDEDYVDTWFGKNVKLTLFNKTDDKPNKTHGFNEHLKQLKTDYDKIKNGDYSPLGSFPKDDTVFITLADLAMAAPAICIDRVYTKYANKELYPLEFPSQIAKLFIDKMNTPESTSVVMTSKSAKETQNEDVHWRNLLSYCVDGNLQSMFDEYAHLLVSGIDETDDIVDKLHRRLGDSFAIKTTPYLVDTFENYTGESDFKVFLRTHFAVSFSKGDAGKQEDVNRKVTVRNAFNSPFRPFVLASTSIGQEGLDFHYYCRKIIHWNLPNNPIDLEQREGRINRYKCLAIRQNIVKRYADKISPKKDDDIWDDLFETAKKYEKGNNSDLIPYWGLNKTDDMIKIKRIIMDFPFSNDELNYDRLISIISLYRLTLGQARQEELINRFENNLKNFSKEEINDLFINLSPWDKSKS